MRRGGRKSGAVSAVPQYSCNYFQESAATGGTSHDATGDTVEVNSPQGSGTDVLLTG
jgi:hypothetical protein